MSNKLARQVVEGVLAGRVSPSRWWPTAAWRWCDDSADPEPAVDGGTGRNPEVAEKIRGGKVQAAGAIVGAVMKATGVRADAARVRELVLAACGQTG